MSDKRVLDLSEQVSNKKANLTENKWKDYCSDLPKWDKGVLATLLEEEAKHIASLDEETRTAAIGSFEKFIFPMIRAVWPNLVSQELVSVQPMEGPISMLFFLDFTAGTAKGAVKKGQELITARTGMREEAQTYQSETVQFEAISGNKTTGTGATTNFGPIRPGSFSATFDNYTSGPAVIETDLVITDNGNGGGTLVEGTSGDTFTLSLNYVTGVWTVAFSGGTTATMRNIVLTYDYNSEGPDFANNPIPQLDASLTSSPVVSHPDKLRARWSVEVAAQLKAIHGLDAEMELTEALAQQIRFGIDNKIINNLWRIAAAGDVTFDVAPAAGIPYFTHQMALIKTLQSGSNMIFKETRRGFGNWIVSGVDAATIMESHPLFESSGNVNGPGVVFSGTLANKWKVFKNPYLNNIAGSGFGSSNFLIGYKGQNFYDAGYVYAPWIPFYQTPTVVLDDMMFRKAVMTHYAVKVVNGLFYCKGNMDHA
jgi:hypothetical protein